jgi:hypothetical protein
MQSSAGPDEPASYTLKLPLLQPAAAQRGARVERAGLPGRGAGGGHGAKRDQADEALQDGGSSGRLVRAGGLQGGCKGGWPYTEATSTDVLLSK